MPALYLFAYNRESGFVIVKIMGKVSSSIACLIRSAGSQLTGFHDTAQQEKLRAQRYKDSLICDKGWKTDSPLKFDNRGREAREALSNRV